ncbi:multidrug transporter [Sesbania bispinosa]|nr:multidrug transporter [Sesbania bispinosa]
MYRRRTEAAMEEEDAIEEGSIFAVSLRLEAVVVAVVKWVWVGEMIDGKERKKDAMRGQRSKLSSS